ncbi:hypothetical protein DFH07DRAFT_1012066 [Mycena maculata]|uniref:DUF6533 domain-containing protein n=1 Tax=Mycena maculata TaxID=230809 RepID=A0AAD7JLG7_9AGAR|nr:hypothetical protein DFH07DRAFT_1012066 [Mycena maculata]
MASQDVSQYIPLVIGGLIPLYVVLVGLTWLLHDYFVTLEDEIPYIWLQLHGGTQVRYYSIALLLFDTIQIHVFARPGITSDTLCSDMDPITRSAGSVLLWSVEIVMQLRIYALYACSKRIGAFHLVLFAGSITGFLWIMLFNYRKRAAEIADVIHLPLPGCPDVNQGIEWALWVPATIYEGFLFSFALFKTSQSTIMSWRKNSRVSLHSLLLRDNITYFFGIAVLLVCNNLMVVNVTHIPWFSYGPFHAAVGVMTTRIPSDKDFTFSAAVRNAAAPIASICFVHSEDSAA